MTLGKSGIYILHQDKKEGVIVFYKILNSSDLKFPRAAFHFLLIFSYITTFSGCMSTYNYPVFSDRIEKVHSSEISKIELNNGTIIDCKNTVIKFEKGADSTKYIILKSYTTGEGYKTYWTEKRIQEKDVYKIYLEKSEVNGTQTTFLVLGIAVAAVIVAIVIGNSKSHFFGGGSWH